MSFRIYLNELNKENSFTFRIDRDWFCVWTLAFEDGETQLPDLTPEENEEYEKINEGMSDWPYHFETLMKRDAQAIADGLERALPLISEQCIPDLESRPVGGISNVEWFSGRKEFIKKVIKFLRRVEGPVIVDGHT